MPRLGTRKLYYLLQEDLKELGVGRDKLHTILKVNGMLVKPLRQYRKTTNSAHYFKKHKDLVRGLVIWHPEQVWVSDITYIRNQKRYYYLSLITDAYSKKIMGYYLGSNLSAELVINSLNMALRQRSHTNPLIHHSDRGYQYCCHAYQRILKKHKVLTSMTENSDPYSNAIAERVNGILKQEFQLERECSYEVLNVIVGRAIETYNNKRPHFSCDLLTPDLMHQQNQIKRKEYKNSRIYQNVIL